MHWLSKQPAWGRSREFEITTRTAGKQGMTSTSNEEDLEDEDDDDDEQLVHGRRKKKVAFLPSLGEPISRFLHFVVFVLLRVIYAVVTTFLNDD